MKINGLTVKELKEIADSLDMEAREIEELGVRVIWIQFKLRLKYGGKRYRRYYITTNAIGNEVKTTKKTAHICHHGWYDFFEKVFKKAPDARVRSMVFAFDGVDDFYKKANRRTDYWGRTSGNHVTTSYYHKESFCECE